MSVVGNKWIKHTTMTQVVYVLVGGCVVQGTASATGIVTVQQ